MSSLSIKDYQCEEWTKQDVSKCIEAYADAYYAFEKHKNLIGKGQPFTSEYVNLSKNRVKAYIELKKSYLARLKRIYDLAAQAKVIVEQRRMANYYKKELNQACNACDQIFSSYYFQLEALKEEFAKLEDILDKYEGSQMSSDYTLEDLYEDYLLIDQDRFIVESTLMRLQMRVDETIEKFEDNIDILYVSKLNLKPEIVYDQPDNN